MSGSTGQGRGYSFRISAEGMQEFAADMRKLSAESDAAAAAFGKLIQASPQLASSITAAEEATKRAADRARDLQQANERAAQAAASLPASNARISDSLDRMEGRALAARRAVADFRGALELLGAGGVSQALGPVASEVGNLADLFGTAALASGSFSTGIASLSSLLAPLAVGVAAVGGAAWALSSAYEAVERRQQEVRAGEDAFRIAMERSNAILRDNAGLVESSAEARRREAIAANENAIAIERENLARANEAAARAAGVRERLEGVAATGRDVSGGLSRARAAELGIAGTATAISDRIAELEANVARMRLVQYDAPIGPRPRVGALPDTSVTVTAPRLRPGAAPREGAAQDAHIRAFQQWQIDDDRRQQEAIRRFEQQSVQAFARIGENALDRIGNSLVDAFVRGEQAALNFGNLGRAVIASMATDLMRLAVINPASNALFAEFGVQRPTLFGAMGAMGMGGGAARGGSAAVTDPSFTGQAPLAAGAWTWGGMLGAGALGALGGGMLAQFTGGNTTGGALGGGAGAMAGLALAPMLGPLAPFAPFIGGAAGGLLGGMFGGRGEGFSGGNAIVTIGPDGRLQLARVEGKNFDTSGLAAQTQQQIAALNQQFGAAGLRFDTSNPALAAFIGGGQDGRTRSLAEAIGIGGMSGAIRADDPRVQGAIDRLGGAGVEQVLATAQQAAQLAQALERIGAPASAFAQQLAAIGAQFDPLIEASRRLGFGEAELTAERQRAIATLEQQRAETLADQDAQLRIRTLRATGQADEAAALEATQRAAAETRAYRASLEALGLTTEEVAARVAVLTDVQAREALAVDARALAAYLAQVAQVAQDAQVAQTRQAEASRTWIDSITSAADAMISQAQRLRDEVDAALLGPNSPLTGEARLSLARERFAAGRLGLNDFLAEGVRNFGTATGQYSDFFFGALDQQRARAAGMDASAAAMFEAIVRGPGFSTGGSFDVLGPPGNDNLLLPARVTAGETVNVSRRDTMTELLDVMRNVLDELRAGNRVRVAAGEATIEKLDGAVRYLASGAAGARLAGAA